MEQAELKSLLDKLIAAWESEVIEFKEAGDSFSTSEIAKYFSALSNEANLRNQERAWLVFGVNNKSRQVTNTDYRVDHGRLHATKKQIADCTEPSVTFREIHELLLSDKQRVVLFEIPAAPRGIPIACNGHYYARAGESLTALGLDKVDEIRRQTLASDWTAQIVTSATIEDLDAEALGKAYESFVRKHAQRIPENEVRSWTTETFLDKARLTQNGRITRAAILLLGKPESTHLLSPHMSQITWKLDYAEERAYEHFSIPFFLATTKVYQKIRNTQLRILPQDELLPVEVSKYDQKIVLEALHNCIAHQDYTQNARIVVTERPDRLIFENAGSFFEGNPDDYVLDKRTPLHYRNSFLVEAMSSLNMIDKMGYGIYDMAKGQASRYFPLPDYQLTERNVVRLTIYGGVVDPAYSRLLIQKTDLGLPDILALDRIQKKLPLPDEAIQRLRREGLVEGRKPNLYVSAAVADATERRADYIRTRALDDEHYKKLITEYLTRFGKATRAELDELLLDKLSDGLSAIQKTQKIGNLLTSLRKAGVIQNHGSDRHPEWQLTMKE
jgi:ATP-dependent DNA helicase RecG